MAGGPFFGEPLKWLLAHVAYQGDECLPWPFADSGFGYGCIRLDGRSVFAHRAMCILAHGEPPSPRSEASHRCGNGHLKCVNPRHLRWTSRSQNIRERTKHGTMPSGPILTVEAVRSIRSRLAGGEKPALLAEEYGVAPSTIFAVKMRASWKRV